MGSGRGYQVVGSFDSLDHGLVVRFVREQVDDPIVLRLIESWLRTGRRDPDVARGIPLGAVISPLLCNVVLHRLDVALVRLGWLIARYADDFVRHEARYVHGARAHTAGRRAVSLSP